MTTDPAFSPCPHCGAKARVERRGPLELRCGICGGPRLVGDNKPEVSENLVRAGKTGRKSKLFRIGSWVIGGVSLGPAALLVLVLIVLNAGLAWVIPTLLFAFFPLLVALWMSREGKKLQTSSNASLRSAFQAEVFGRLEGKEQSAQQIAADLGVPETEIDPILAELNASDTVRSRVTDDGELVYSVGPRLRISEAELADLAEDTASDEPAHTQRRR